MPGRWAGSGVGLVHTLSRREPKTGQQKVQLFYEDDPLCPSSYTYYLSMKTILNCQICNRFTVIYTNDHK